MLFESAQHMAERLGVSLRMVQIWAKEGKLPGAVKQGRDWLIPAGLERPKRIKYTQNIDHSPLPLISGKYQLGAAMDYINEIELDDFRNLALAEYYYFNGQVDEAIKITEIFYNHENVVIKMSACLIYVFSNLSLGNVMLAGMGLGCIEQTVSEELTDENTSPQFKALCILIETTAKVMLHRKTSVQPLLDNLKYLSNGLQAWACCVLSHNAFIENKYDKALGITELALSIFSTNYPIPAMYLQLTSGMTLMALKDVEKAKVAVNEAWKYAYEDGLYHSFGEHHSLLCGLVEACIKDKFPYEFQIVSSIADRFRDGWRTIHNTSESKTIAKNLSANEFAISMLANRGWSNQEIADYMRLSLHTVKRYISIVYQKLNITNRNELKQFMHM